MRINHMLLIFEVEQDNDVNVCWKLKNEFEYRRDIFSTEITVLGNSMFIEYYLRRGDLKFFYT